MSEQLDAWTGDFGNSYHQRQTEYHGEVAKREVLWAQVLALLPRLRMNILEVGAGTGVNLEAIRRLYQSIGLVPRIWALEPNDKARAKLIETALIVPGTAQDIIDGDRQWDLVFTYGVLIHLEDPLPAMREIFRVSRRFIFCAEYFAPGPEIIPYRDGVLLRRNDYGSLWMDNFDLKLLGYGFVWKRATGLDNVTWWLFERKDFQLQPLSLEEQKKAIAGTL